MELLIIFVLAIVNGVFALSETAVVAARKARLTQRVEEGDKNAAAALKLAQEPARFFSTIQIGITLIGQLSGAFAGATLAEQLARWFEQQESPLAPYAPGISFTLVVLLTTYISLIIGELVPKALAVRSPETIASVMAIPMLRLSRLTSPLVGFLTASTNLVLRIMGVRPNLDPPVTEEEIVAMVEQGVAAGVFTEANTDMIEGVLGLEQRRVSQIMTPRTEVVWLNILDSAEENQQKIIESNFSRFPVCQGDLDHVVGILSAKDMLAHLFQGKPFDLRAVMHDAIFIPESMVASRLLERFRESGHHSAVVIGEYGGLEGMITIQDILEDIVGDIEEPEVTQREDGTYLVDGMMSIDDFIDLMDIDEIPGSHDEFETLAGFVLTQTGHIPKVGEKFTWKAITFEIMDMDGNRVDKVLVTPPPKNSGAADNTSATN